jgi:Response regulator of the LytR/AlgR family
MLRIAICDDEALELSHVCTLIKEYQEHSGCALRFDMFTSATELLETMKIGAYDLLLLDILMPGVNGMQTAREIRGYDQDIKIVFLTSSPEFAVDSYAVNAYYYLLKPVSQIKLFPILDKIFLDFTRAREALSVKHSSGIMRIFFDRLEFLEVMNKKLYFHQTDGCTKEIYGTLSEYETALLDREEFIKIHRSYIINMGWIKDLKPGMLTTNSGHKLPISRLLYPQVRDGYMNYLFFEKGAV